MRENRVIMRSTAALVLLSLILSCSGCQRDKIDSLNAELAKTVQERDSLQEKVNEITANNEQLKQQYDKLEVMQKNLEGQIEALTKARDALQTQVKLLTDARDAEQIRVTNVTKENETLKQIVDDLKKNQNSSADLLKKSLDQVKGLASQLDTERKRVVELEEQIKNIQDAFKEFQNKANLKVDESI